MQTNIVKADTRGMSHEDWLEARRNGIGGSDAGAIMGVSKWSSPLSVYMDKIGKSVEKEETEAMRQGTDLEPYVAERFVRYMEEKEGRKVKVRRCNKILVHPDYPWMIANIDRDIVGEDAGLECKTASTMNRCDYAAGNIPETYYYQCLHYMAVTGASHWYLAVLQYSRDFHVFDIPRNDDRIEMLIQAEEDFWNNHVLAKVPPLPTGDDNDTAMVNVLYPIVAEVEKVDISEMENDLQVRDMLKSQLKKLESDIDEIENRIKMKLGDHVGGFSNSYIVNWGQYERSSFDKKKLLEDHPEFEALIKQYTTIKPQRRFMATKVTE